MTHPLDRAVWCALTTRQADLAISVGPARRLAPDYGLFAALEEVSPESLASLRNLVRAQGEAALFEPEPPTQIAGMTITPGDPLAQMVAEAPVFATPRFDVVALSDADAAEMLELATLTRPGPFFAHTHQLGDFVGVRVGGRLAAMAGERLRVPGFTEVSAVCTHPDFRGHGYAAGLMSVVARAIVARGERPFLHVYDHNKGAIALYERLGYRRRRAVTVSFVRAA